MSVTSFLTLSAIKNKLHVYTRFALSAECVYCITVIHAFLKPKVSEAEGKNSIEGQRSQSVARSCFSAINGIKRAVFFETGWRNSRQTPTYIQVRLHYTGMHASVLVVASFIRVGGRHAKNYRTTQEHCYNIILDWVGMAQSFVILL